MAIEIKVLEQHYSVRGADGSEGIPQGTMRIQVQYKDGNPEKMIYIGEHLGEEGLSALRETWDRREIERILALAK